jgi:hypothetical protein
MARTALSPLKIPPGLHLLGTGTLLMVGLPYRKKKTQESDSSGLPRRNRRLKPSLELDKGEDAPVVEWPEEAETVGAGLVAFAA